MTRVAILWHMHQPYYQDLVTHEHILPWVRLHALKDYWGMVALMREFPGVKLTFNLVPSLLTQIEAFADDQAQDRFLELSLKPAGALSQADAEFIVQNFFHAQRERMIDAYPRYAELLALRGGTMPTTSDRRAVCRRFSTDDLRDLQVWHKLAWIDPFYLEGDARVRMLVEKGRKYTEEDKTLLHEVELELLRRVIPEYREAAQRGQVELSMSPFYHPILPLLCDTDVYLRTHPDSRMPRRRFQHPEDAVEQLQRAVACHERLFGRPPTGVWPSEGSVSDAMIPLVQAAGLRWMATDEQILAQTQHAGFSRDSDGHLDQPERLYTAYDVVAGGAHVACGFRDHALSDLIGFHYAGWPADRAADDFVGRLAEGGRRCESRNGGGEPVIFVILDGENAWEHFEGGGRPFLRALYSRLASHPELRTVTMAEACETPTEALHGIFPGSWIDANFYIWIGHQDDQRGWSQLADAHDVLLAAAANPAVSDAALAKAREELLIAEGSDWFWWYGDDHSSAHDLEFDDLFRRHVRNVYRVLEKPIPDELFVSNISNTVMPVDLMDPTALVSPTIDGEDTSYFEWLGAGLFEVRDAAGAMHQAERRASVLTLLQFGFDRERMYLRVDATRRVDELLRAGQQLAIKFLEPAGETLVIRLGADRRCRIDPAHLQRSEAGLEMAAGQVLEVAIPLAGLGVRDGDRVGFVVALLDAAGQELERHPAHRPIECVVPDARFEAVNWTA